MKTIPIKPAKRECGDCHACCEGWLAGKVYDRIFMPGHPCHFLGASGCSIYKDRPQDPCKSFVCEWIANENVPMWMRPDLSKVIISKRQHSEVAFFDVTTVGAEMSTATLNWLFGWAMANKLNILYRVNGTVHRVGSEEFNKLTFN